MNVKRIGSVSEYLQPVPRKLDHGEVIEVASELADKLYATAMLLTYNDGGDCMELLHKDLMAVIHGLCNDSRTLCQVLDNKGSEQ